MRNVLVAALLLGAAIPVPASADETERVSKTVQLAPGGTLRLKNFSGRVTITGTDRSDASIEAVRHATRERLDRIKLDIHTEGSTLVINANQRDDSSSRRSRNDNDNNVVETDLDIKLPRRTSLDIDVFSSPVSVDGVDGSHKVHSFSSKLLLSRVNGPIRAHTFSGAVEISQSTWAADQSIDVDTFSGSVRLQVPENARGSVSFNSFSGRLDSDVPLTFRNSSRRSLRAELGGSSNGGTLTFKTFSGSVHIKR